MWAIAPQEVTHPVPYLPTTSGFFFFFLFSSELLVVLETPGRPPFKPHVLRAQPAACYPCCHSPLQLLDCSVRGNGQPLSSLWVAICVTAHGPLVSTPDWLLSTGSGQTHHGGGCPLEHKVVGPALWSSAGCGCSSPAPSSLSQLSARETSPAVCRL